MDVDLYCFHPKRYSGSFNWGQFNKTRHQIFVKTSNMLSGPKGHLQLARSYFFSPLPVQDLF